jgi:hypothetical protein
MKLPSVIDAALAERSERSIRPAIVRSAVSKTQLGDVQWELPLPWGTSYGWRKTTKCGVGPCRLGSTSATVTGRRVHPVAPLQNRRQTG